jgi:hypothetical protein
MLFKKVKKYIILYMIYTTSIYDEDTFFLVYTFVSSIKYLKNYIFIKINDLIN